MIIISSVYTLFSIHFTHQKKYYIDMYYVQYYDIVKKNY